MAIHFTECAALTDLPAAKKLVLMACADSADKDTRVSLPGFETIRTWSGLGRAQAYAVITELLAMGYLARRAGGVAGRRAEFFVFPGGGCCPLHGRLPDYTGPVPGEPETPGAGSGQADPAPAVDDADPAAPESGEGSGQGSDEGSGLDRTPSRLPGYENPPNPPASPGGARSSCKRKGHAARRRPNCRGCGTHPRAEEAAAELAAAQAAAAEVDRIRTARAELAHCGHPDCDRATRWLTTGAGTARCSACHPDVVVGRPTAAQLQLAAQLDPASSTAASHGLAPSSPRPKF